MSQPESSWRIIVLFHAGWMRVLTACLSGIAAMVYAITLSDTTPLREQAATSLQATMFVLGVTVGLATYLVSNYVRGLHSDTLTKLRTIRTTLWSIYTEYQDAADPGIRAVVSGHVMPLLDLGQEDWFNPVNFDDWSVGIDQELDRIADEKAKYVLTRRYLLPLEEYTSELRIAFMRGIMASRYTKATFGVIGLLISAIAVNAVVRLLPIGTRIDLFVIGICIAVITMSLVELIVIFSYIWMNARDEFFSFMPSEPESTPGDSGDLSGKVRDEFTKLITDLDTQREATPNPTAPADQKAPLPGR